MDKGSSFMDELGRALEDEPAAAAVERRGRDPGSYAGKRRRRGEPDFAEMVDVAERRFKPWMKVAAVVAPVFTILAGWGVLDFPLQTKVAAQEAQAAINKRVDGIEGRVERLEGTLSDVLTTGKESQELQLIERIERLQARAESKPRGSQEYIDARRDVAEAEQRLAKVRRELGR